MSKEFSVIVVNIDLNIDYFLFQLLLFHWNILHNYHQIDHKITLLAINIEILQRYQSKILGAIASGPWCVVNKSLHKDLGTPTIVKEIRDTSTHFRGSPSDHANPLAILLLDKSDEAVQLKSLCPCIFHTDNKQTSLGNAFALPYYQNVHKYSVYLEHPFSTITHHPP